MELRKCKAKEKEMQSSQESRNAKTQAVSSRDLSAPQNSEAPVVTLAWPASEELTQ